MLAYVFPVRFIVFSGIFCLLQVSRIRLTAEDVDGADCTLLLVNACFISRVGTFRKTAQQGLDHRHSSHILQLILRGSGHPHGLRLLSVPLSHAAEGDPLSRQHISDLERGSFPGTCGMFLS